MDLYIDTSNKEETLIQLKDGEKLVVEKVIENHFDQAEKLLPEIDRMLKNSDIELEAPGASSSGDTRSPKKRLEKIYVNSQGDSFTSLRIGVITANALAYALRISVEDFENNSIKKENIEIVKPNYSSEPNITQPRG